MIYIYIYFDTSSLITSPCLETIIFIWWSSEKPYQFVYNSCLKLYFQNEAVYILGLKGLTSSKEDEFWKALESKMVHLWITKVPLMIFKIHSQ